MSVFQYKALDVNQKVVTDHVEAIDKNDVIAILKKKKLSPLSIEATTSDRQASNRSRSVTLSGRVGKRDVMHATAQLAALLQSKLPLTKALRSLSEQAPKPALRTLFEELEGKVSEGTPFSDALSEYPRHFSRLYVNMVRIGEVGGSLEDSLGRVAEMLEKDDELRSKIVGALTYPAIMATVMAGSVVVLLAYVVPQFTGMFEEMDVALPFPTQVLLAFSDFCKKWWMAVVAGLVIAVFGFRQFLKNPDNRRLFDQCKLRVPLAGALLMEIALSRFTLSLGALLEGGVNMIQALSSTVDATGNTHVAAFLRRVVRRVDEGETLSSALRSEGDLFPPLAVGMIKTGEDSGSLGLMLNNIGKYYSKEADAKVKSITTLLEPAMIVIMGVLVGFTVMAMLLPIFEMSSSVR